MRPIIRRRIILKNGTRAIGSAVTHAGNIALIFLSAQGAEALCKAVDKHIDIRAAIRSAANRADMLRIPFLRAGRSNNDSFIRMGIFRASAFPTGIYRSTLKVGVNRVL